MNGAVALLETSGLMLRAGTRTLVAEMSFSVAAGEFWCVLGPNGAGKTTLLHTLAGLRTAAPTGTVLWRGEPPDTYAPEQAARWRGLLPQAQHDSFSASALDVVLLGRHPHRHRWSWDAEDDRRIAHDALAAVDAVALATRDVTTLSGGERQRVAIAALLAQQVPLMLLDEPTAHLDLKHQVSVLAHLVQTVRSSGGAALVAMHDLNLAARFASHALLLQPDGRAAVGPVDDVLDTVRLSHAFDHPVQRERVGGRWIFIAG
jgi:iron complex transport system ATP-binding protein